MTESGFFSVYAHMPERDDKQGGQAQKGAPPANVDPRELPIVREALASIEDGGYVEALARVAVLLTRKGEPLPLARLELRAEVAKDYADYLPEMGSHEWRRIRGEQEVIARYEPDLAVQTLPRLLADRAQRQRLLGLLEKLMADERVQDTGPSDEQVTMLGRIRKVLAEKSVKTAPARQREQSL
jgi:hypothetical protein